jgi:hypothetical protein
MRSVAWIFFIPGNRLTKNAFAAGVGTLSPAGKSKSGATDGGQTDAFGVPDRRLPRGAAGVDHAGFSSPVRPSAATAESPDSAKIAPVRNATAENAPAPKRMFEFLRIPPVQF